MKKLVLAILMIAVAMPAFASETRVMALGPNTAPYIQDDSGVFMWPATLVSYANLVTITAVSDSLEAARFGLTYGLGEDNRFGVFGIWWHEGTMGPNSDGSWYGPPGFTDFSSPKFNKWNVMWALGFETIDIGIRFERADEMNKTEVGSVTNEDYISYTTLGLGFGMELGDAANLDVAFDYTTVGYTNQGGGTEIWEADSKSRMALRARMFYEWTDVITWVPYFNYRGGNFSIKSNESQMLDDECWGIKGYELDFGLAANLNVNDDNLIIVGIEPYGIRSGEPSECGNAATSEKIKTTILPGFVFGLESDVKDWLTFRAGCDKVLRQTTTERTTTGSDPYKNTVTTAPFDWYLGLGFHVSDFDIDLLLNKEVPFSMGYWMTGFVKNGEDASPILMISATYSF